MPSDLTDQQPTLEEMERDREFALGGLIALAEHHFKQTNPHGVHLREIDFVFLVAYIRTLQQEKKQLAAPSHSLTQTPMSAVQVGDTVLYLGWWNQLPGEGPPIATATVVAINGDEATLDVRVGGATMPIHGLIPIAKQPRQ